MTSLSVVIVVQDEERTIGRVLSAIKELCDEIVLVDSGSKDRTIDIATEYGARVIHQPWLGYGAQKNFAIDQASGDWILSLDADEIVTPPLAQEIKRVLADAQANGLVNSLQGFRIPRVLFIGDVPLRHGGFFPDAQLRLFKKGAGKFNDRLVHEAVRVEGKVGVLSGEMHHFSYANEEGFAAAMEKYARLSAQEYQRQGKFGWRTNPINEAIHPVWTMFYRYVFRAGFLDGALGWRLNMIYGDYVRKKIRYLRELKGSKSVESGP